MKFEKRKGRTYAYECTSERVPWRDTPVMRKTHLGVVDPETGEIISKRVSGSETLQVLEDGVDVSEYGNVLIALSAVRRSGIMDDLREVLEDGCREYVAVAVAMALRPSDSEGISRMLSETCLCGMMGLDPTHMLPSRVRGIVNGVGLEEMTRYFELRGRRSESRIFVFGRPNQFVELDRYDPSIDWLGDIAPTDVVATAIDGSGAPLGFLHIDNPDLNLSNLVEVMERYSKANPGCTFVSDRSLSSFVDLGRMVMSGMDFIIPFTSASERFAEAEGCFSNLRSGSNLRQISRSDIYVAERRAWLCLSDGGWSVVFSEEGSQSGVSIRAFMVFDPSLELREVHVMRYRLDMIRERFDGADRNMMSDLRKVAGRLARFLSVSEDGGRIRVRVRRSDVTGYAERNATVLILASAASWETVVDAYVARSRFHASLDMLDGGSAWILNYMEGGVVMENHLFLRLVALQIYDAISRGLGESGSKLSVKDALALGASYKLVSLNGVTVRSRRDRRLSRLFTLMGIEETEDPLTFMGGAEDHLRSDGT